MSDVPDQDGGGRRYLALIAVAVVVAGVAFGVTRIPNNNPAPFTPSQADAKLVGLQVLTPTDAAGSNITAALQQLRGSAANHIEVPGQHNGWQYVVGRVDVDAQYAPQTRYSVIVVDDRDHQVVASTVGYPIAGQSAGTGQGWDAADESLHDQYDWQTSASDQAAFFTPDGTTSYPFWARLPADALAVKDLDSDVSVILAFTSGSNHVYWSEKLN